MAIVGGVSGVDLGGAIPRKQGLQRFVDQRRITAPGKQLPSVVQQRRIDSRAESCASHAITMPHPPVASPVELEAIRQRLGSAC